MALSKIRGLFETRSVYQSLVVCEDTCQDLVLGALLDEGYPAVPGTEEAGIEAFVTFKDRMLVLPRSLWDVSKPIVTGPTVNVIIFVDCQPEDGDTFLMRHASVFIFSL
jgi:hypothetical protein